MPVDNACDLRRIIGVDKDIVCMKIIMPNDTTSDTLAMRDDMAVDFEEILQDRQLRFVGWGNSRARQISLVGSPGGRFWISLSMLFLAGQVLPSRFPPNSLKAKG